MKNKVLAMMTMNAGDGISGSTIKYCLKTFADRFDRVIVIDGDLTDEAKKFYSSFPNLLAVDSPWRDSYVDQYRAWSAAAMDGDWILYLDCDELPSEALVSFINSEEMSDWIADGTNTLMLRCMLHLTEDEFKYYPNPTSGIIKFNSNKIIEHITIYNSLGQEVKSISTAKMKLELDVSSYSQGVYFIKLIIDNDVKRVSIIKK